MTSLGNDLYKIRRLDPKMNAYHNGAYEVDQIYEERAQMPGNSLLRYVMQLRQMRTVTARHRSGTDCVDSSLGSLSPNRFRGER